MLDAELHAQVATRLLADMEREVKKAVTDGAKGIGDDLVAAIKRSPGPAPYGAVYARLASRAKVRTRPGRPPEVVIGGGKAFSGGGTINQLVWAYEYGSATGDLRKGPSRLAGTHKRKGRKHVSRRRGGRTRHYQVTPQFPPWNQQGNWINEIVDSNKEKVLDTWVRLVDEALADVARKDHG